MPYPVEPLAIAGGVRRLIVSKLDVSPKVVIRVENSESNNVEGIILPMHDAALLRDKLNEILNSMV